MPTRRERCNHAHRGRLRIVDHNRRAALGLQQRVTRLGDAVVATAASGREALVVGAASRPHVVLMEIRLPGPVDGLQEGTQILGAVRHSRHLRDGGARGVHLPAPVAGLSGGVPGERWTGARPPEGA